MFTVQYVRMSNSTNSVGDAPVLSNTKEPACHLVPPATPGQRGEQRDTKLQPRTIGRPDTLTAQRIEVGIVLNAMLGLSAAAEYLQKHGIDALVVQRVLNPGGRRRGSHDASGVQI